MGITLAELPTPITREEQYLYFIAENASGKVAYVIKGNSTFENLPDTLTADMGGWTYNITNDFVTTSDFVEGAGRAYSAGTNVVIVNTGTEETPVMKFDVIGAFVDVSAIEDEIADVSGMIASDFISTQAYTVGDYAVYDGDLYKFKAAHTANTDWNNAEVDLVTVSGVLKTKANAADVYTKVQSDDRYILQSSIQTDPTTAEINQAIINIWGS